MIPNKQDQRIKATAKMMEIMTRTEKIAIMMEKGQE
jgi:hypothetical protein